MAKIGKSCFVIGPIGAPDTPTRKAADWLLNGIIKPALSDYADLRIWRADEDSQPGMITDKLISDLFGCDIVIADLTELNPNALYELGIRHAAAKPTIHMAANGTKLPFDNLGHRTIFFDLSDWSNVENAKRHLKAQYEETLSDTFKASNPVVQAISVQAFKASPKPEDNMLAYMMERLEVIEGKLTPRNTDIIPRPLTESARVENLIGAITNFSRGPAGKKIEIFPAQIKSYAQANSNEASYWRIMESLKSGNCETILKEVSDEIPF